MVTVHTKKHLKCNKTNGFKIASQDISLSSPMQDEQMRKTYKNRNTGYIKVKDFSVKYCTSCQTAWEKIREGRSGIQHYQDFPMKRKLEHNECPHCIEDKRKAENDALIKEAAQFITNYMEEEKI